MTTDELNAIVKAVMDELEKAGVDFDFKAETPQPTDLVYVMRGTADKYMGITVKWQNLLDIIVKKATDAKNEAVSAKDIALQTLATIQGIESNISSMKSSVETTKSQVETMKASVEASEANVTQMKSDVSTMKTSVEGTKTEVESLKSDVTTLKAQTQTIVDNAKDDVTGLLDTKINKTDALTYEEIMATNADLTNKVSSANALRDLALIVNLPFRERGLSTDLNTALDSGAYTFVPGNSANSPFGYGVLLVINPKLYYVVQIAISVTGEGVKYRFSINGGESWDSWRTI